MYRMYHVKCSSIECVIIVERVLFYRKCSLASKEALWPALRPYTLCVCVYMYILCVNKNAQRIRGRVAHVWQKEHIFRMNTHNTHTHSESHTHAHTHTHTHTHTRTRTHTHAHTHASPPKYFYRKAK